MTTEPEQQLDVFDLIDEEAAIAAVDAEVFGEEDFGAWVEALPLDPSEAS